MCFAPETTFPSRSTCAARYNEQAQPCLAERLNVGRSALLGLDYTTPLKRSLVSSESGRGERQLALTCSVPRRRE